MIVIGLIIGLIIGFFIGFLINRFISKIKEPIKKKYLRRGLIERNYSVDNNNIHVVFEIGEIECTDTLSKVEVISFKTDRSKYNNGNTSLISMVDKSWIESNSIKWITTVVEKRNQKIDEILT